MSDTRDPLMDSIIYSDPGDVYIGDDSQLGLGVPGRIYDILDEVSSYGDLPPDYVEKMVHKIPRAPVFDRADYLLEAAKDKVILDIGASGPMALKLQEVAKEYYGVDIVDNPAIKNMAVIDVEDGTFDIDPYMYKIDLVIAGEFLEHLSNAGNFLDSLHCLDVPVILTTPNARAIAGKRWGDRGTECVNGSHVAWYSYHTLKVLTERHGFKTHLWGWYNGEPYTAEGLIFHIGPVYGKD